MAGSRARPCDAVMDEEDALLSLTLRSLSSFLGPPQNRRSKFVGEARKSGEENFELTRDALRLLEYAVLPQGLAQTVVGSIAGQHAIDTRDVGVAWTVAIALSLHLKLKRRLARDAPRSVSTGGLRACLVAAGEASLAIASATKSMLGDVDHFRDILAHGETSAGVVPEDDAEEVSWFFHPPGAEREELGEGAREYTADRGALLAKVCQSLHSGASEDNGDDPAKTVERLAHECLANLLSHHPHPEDERSAGGDPVSDNLGLVAAARSRMASNWAEESLDVLQVTGPSEEASFVLEGLLLRISKWREVVAAAAGGPSLPTHDLTSSTGKDRWPKFRRVRAILLAGNLSVSGLVARGTSEEGEGSGGDPREGVRGRLGRKDASFAKLRAQCKAWADSEWRIDLVLIEGSLDSRAQTELQASGILSISGLGAKDLCRLSKASGSFVAADVLSIDRRHVASLEACLVKCGGHLSSSLEDFGAGTRPGLGEGDLWFLAARAARTGGLGSPSTVADEGPDLTLFVSSLLGAGCDLVASEVKKLVNRALCALAHGFLPGGGRFEKILIRELRSAARATQSTEVQAMVFDAFALALEDVVDLSLGHGSGGEEAASGIHFDGFWERSCGIRRAVEMVVAMVSTDAIIINNSGQR